MPPVKGSGLATLTSGRGAAFGDLFNNGKIDVVINPIDGPPVLLKNVNPDHHHWVELKLVGGPKSPRDAVGATVYLTRERHAAARGRDERGQLHLVERPAAALRPGRRDGCGNGGDSLAIGGRREREAAGGGSHLHHHRGTGITGVLCAKQPCFEQAGWPNVRAQPPAIGNQGQDRDLMASGITRPNARD